MYPLAQGIDMHIASAVYIMLCLERFMQKAVLIMFSVLAGTRVEPARCDNSHPHAVLAEMLCVQLMRWSCMRSCPAVRWRWGYVAV